MGLDTSHDCWHGAYSAFTRWRHEVAKAAGYAVWSVTYDNGWKYDTIMLDWGHITPKQLMGEWEATPNDPLIVLFAHSDCEGSIYPDQARPLADALEAIMPKLSGDYGGHIGDISDKTRTFIDGLRKAVAANEPVEFH